MSAFTALADLSHMSDAYLRLKVRELQRWHADAKDAEWRDECATQLAAFNAEIKRRRLTHCRAIRTEMLDLQVTYGEPEFRAPEAIRARYRDLQKERQTFTRAEVDASSPLLTLEELCAS